MNQAIAYLTLAVEKYTEAKPFAEACGGPYKTNFDAKMNAAQALLAKSIQENKTIYYESQIPTSELPKPDPQNFVNLQTQADEINARASIEDKLCHLVPPQVRALQDELKQQLSGILQQEFTKTAEKEEQMTGFLS